MKITYEFNLDRDSQGSLEPSIKVLDLQFQDLMSLARGYEMTSSKGVAIEIEKIKKVLNGEINEVALTGDGWCTLYVHKENTLVTNGFDVIASEGGFDDYKVPTLELLRLMVDWHAFLVKHNL